MPLNEISRRRSAAAAAGAQARCARSRGQHVTELAPPTTPDWDIWSLARGGGYVVVSKDEDFADLTQRRGGEVAVVWLRCGNINNDELIALIERHLPTITESLSRGPRLVEVS